MPLTHTKVREYRSERPALPTHSPLPTPVEMRDSQSIGAGFGTDVIFGQDRSTLTFGHSHCYRTTSHH